MTPNQKAALMAVKQLLYCALDGFTDEELLRGACVVVDHKGTRYGFDTDGAESIDQIMTTIERAGSAVALEYGATNG